MRRSPLPAVPAALILVALALGGCYLGSAATMGADGGGGDSGGGSGPDAPGGTSPQSGLPCDVAQAMRPCLSCHVTGGSGPMALVTYADLTKADLANPGVTVAAASLARMQDNGMPMPPAPLPRSTAADETALASWIQASYPQGSCVPDGGAAADDPLNAAPTCTSGVTHAGGSGTMMHPGRACVSCHGSGEGPIFAIAGTVYPTGHEPDECASSLPAGVTVVITGATGHSVTLTPNGNGNFTSSASLALPYTAVVTLGSRTRVMATPQQSGDCNSCHTPTGANGAPGRITVPAP